MNDRMGSLVLCLGLVAAVPPNTAISGGDCSQTSIGVTPINDLGPGLYLNMFQGGLYPGGANVPPGPHIREGRERAAAIEPLDVDGNPDPEGAYVFLSMGMSNTTQEFCSQPATEPCNPWTFMGKAAQHPQVNHTTLRIVNGAKAGQTADTWDSPTDANYDRVRDTVLTPQGLSELQVQAVWVKVANSNPTQSLPAPDADAYVLLAELGDIARAIRVRYPNVKAVFLSSRIYAGYATTPLNPEPYAYESALAVKWLIEAQIEQMAGGGPDPIAGNLNWNTVAPWLAWGPYTWADGLVPRSDGLIWECGDLQSDGTHPARRGEGKVGSMLLQFFLNSPFTKPWFRLAAGLDAR